MKKLFAIVCTMLLNFSPVLSQQTTEFNIIIDEIGKLESNRDPKCHATASRLENFMYGTPLSFEARNSRIEFQRNYIKHIWLNYSRQLKNKDKPDPRLFMKIEGALLRYTQNEQDLEVSFSTGNQLFLGANDFRQYSTVAYALRAILSVQQSFLFEEERLAPLNTEALEYFKRSVDVAVLSILQVADSYARAENKSEIDQTHISLAVKTLFPHLDQEGFATAAKAQQPEVLASMLNGIIQQKLAAYEKYNHINQAVFLRNIQVYFSRIPWPTEKEPSDQLKSFFTEALIQVSGDMLKLSQTMALQANKNSITYPDVYNSVQVYMPHELNHFEDVIYFPKLEREERITIESYDLDAFRDSGLHWQYLQAALQDKSLQLSLAPDPFALEMLVEGIAQFAVLLFRMGGTDAIQNNQEVLEVNNLLTALKEIQYKLDVYKNVNSAPLKSSIVSSKKKVESPGQVLFTDATDEVNLHFEHRNADWLNRLIRSYVVKKEENLARLAIPPAFGGGGVAAEDIDQDGWVDILLLGGHGNQLLKNDKGNGFIDITKQAGLSFPLDDGTFGEPRQPIIVDFDNDGLQDIFITYVNAAHRIYRNQGNGLFEDMTSIAQLGGEGLVGGPATSIDYDQDGLLDLYIGYFGNYIKGELPTLKRHNTNGIPNKLFRNLGGFRFEEVSEKSGLQNSGWTQAVGHSDINGDGWQDLIVGNDFGTNAYYINQGDGTFIDHSPQLGTDKPSFTMNVGIGDLNRDLRPDFYISNIVVMEKDDKYVLPNENTTAHFDPKSLSTMRVVEANDLFLSSTDKKGQLTYLISKDVGRGYSATGWSWDADFFDFDNDGDDDLYCLTGMNPYSVYGSNNEYYTSPEGSNKEVVFANSKAEHNILFTNEGGILEVAKASGLDYSSTSRSAAYFDADHDGDLDIIVNDYQGQARFFRNHTKSSNGNWVQIKLVGSAPKVTKDAIGAIIILTTEAGTKLWQEVHSTTGYLSGHPKMLHFGLGDATRFDVEIKWPDGQIQIKKNLQVNSQHTILQKAE